MEQTLPHNLDAERSVLGAILTHNDAFETVREILRPPDFYRDAHQRIYAAMTRLIDERHVDVDFVTLKAELLRRGELEEVGGPAYIASLGDGVPRSTNARYYGGIVKDRARLRAIIYAANRALSSAYTAEDSPDQILKDADRAFLDIGDSGGARLKPLSEMTRALFERIEYRIAHKGELTGVDTGYPSINAETLGWQPGDLNIIAARPSIGKTAFVVNSMLNAAMGPGQVRIAYFSLEMTEIQILDRLVARLAGVDAMRVRSGQLGARDMEAIGAAIAKMHTLPIHIDERVGLTAQEIRSASRRLKAESGLDLVVVDYGQLIKGSLDRRGANRNEEMTDIATRLKNLGGELELPVVLLSQLSRANEKRPDPKPKLSDLRESGSLEQIAALVAFLHRRNHRESGTTQFVIEKQRNGPTGSLNLTFDRDLQLFTDGGDDPEPPPERPQKPRKQGKGPRARRAPGPMLDDDDVPPHGDDDN